jgi:hypothetical protein
MEDFVAQTTSGQDSIEAFHPVQPRCACRGKVQVEKGVFCEPGSDLGVLMGGVIVDDQVQLAIRWRLRVDLLEESQPFLMAMPGLAAAQHGAIECIERGEQCGGAMALIIMGLGTVTTLAQGQAGLGANQRLNLAFFVHAQDQSFFRRIQIQAYNRHQFLGELRIVADFEAGYPGTLEPVTAPNAPYARWSDPRSLGHKSAPIFCGSITRGRPERGRSVFNA